MSVAENLQRIRERIRAAAVRAGRRPEEIELVAVSKLQPVAAIREAYAAGQRVFGENYAQELRDKAKELAELPELRFHAIGRLQKNKAKYVAPVAAMFEALDDLGLAEELDKRARAAGKVLPVLLEVNFDEAQKGGVLPGRVGELLEQVTRFDALSVEGLMCIPPPAEDPEASRPYFRRLRELAAEHRLTKLSMGMSADFEQAIEEGAHLVRVGTAIFGPRAG